MLGVFSRIDLASAYWRGGDAGNQTKRMAEFMHRFIGRPRHLCSVAVQMWRHTLVHTSEPRPLHNPKTGEIYRYLLHWGKHLPEPQHFTLTDNAAERILNLGLRYLLSDLRKGVEAFLEEAARDVALQARMESFEHKLQNLQLRPA
jgi:hypothetical protein